MSSGALWVTRLRRNQGVALLSGGEFQLDGVPISGLDSPGDILPFATMAIGVLTGVLEDGTPFAVSNEHDADDIGDSVIILRRTDLPAVSSGTIIASLDPIPWGIRNGQTLLVNDGSEVPANFNAGDGGIVVVENGGLIHGNLEATGAQISVAGGEIRAVGACSTDLVSVFPAALLRA